MLKQLWNLLSWRICMSFVSPSGRCWNDGLYSYFIFVVLLCFDLTSSYSQITHQLLSIAICGVTSMTSRTHGQVLRQSLITMEIIRMLLFLMQDQDIGMILIWWGYWLIATLVVGCNTSLVSTGTFSTILKTHTPHYCTHNTLKASDVLQIAPLPRNTVVHLQ